MKFFIASDRGNAKQIKFLTDNLISFGHSVSVDDITGLAESDKVIMLLPADIPTYISAGIAYGFGKHLTLIGDPQSAQNRYLTFDKDFKTIEEFVETLRPKA